VNNDIALKIFKFLFKALVERFEIFNKKLLVDKHEIVIIGISQIQFHVKAIFYALRYTCK
jgi:hypothetical protein